MERDGQGFTRRDFLKYGALASGVILGTAACSKFTGQGDPTTTLQPNVEATYLVPPHASSAARKPLAKSVNQLTRNLPADHFIHNGPATRPNVGITIDDFFGTDGLDYLESMLTLARKRHVKFTLFPTGGALQDLHSTPRASRQKECVRRARCNHDRPRPESRERYDR